MCVKNCFPKLKLQHAGRTLECLIAYLIIYVLTHTVSHLTTRKLPLTMKLMLRTKMSCKFFTQYYCNRLVFQQFPLENVLFYIKSINVYNQPINAQRMLNLMFQKNYYNFLEYYLYLYYHVTVNLKNFNFWLLLNYISINKLLVYIMFYFNIAIKFN